MLRALGRAAVVAASMCALAPAGATAREEPAAVRLEAVMVEPATAAPDTLCHLTARIRNAGESTASGFAFRLKLDQQEVGSYRDYLFMDPIVPGETRTLVLWSFWTNETGRPLPESGSIAVELTLSEARWMKEEKDAEGTRVWTDLGAVEGLPQTARASVAIKK
jgi:hypothetical protein